jgi:2',3'-cyclic-nucleotide 2'-phosphodiesterase (5'-nucleotidase family)
VPKGGLARRATAIRQEREASDDLVLVLDAGNALFGAWVSFRSQGRVIVEGMNAMGYDAMVVGAADLAMGLDALREREAEASFAFLSANVMPAGGGAPMWEPYTIIERDGLRVGVIGITDPEAASTAEVRGVIAVEDPTLAAARHVAELRDQVDLLVVLSRLGLDRDMVLAQAVGGIDIIVGGSSGRLMREPERVGDTLVIQQGYRGEWLGRLTARFDERGIPDAYSVVPIILGPEYGDDAAMAEMVSRWSALHPTPKPAAQ